MSPEQCQAKRVTGRSDLYSLGVLLYEMLTGSPPYNGRDSRTIMVRHIKDPPPKLPFRHRACQPLCDALMAKAPSDRPGSMNALQKLAAGALGEEPRSRNPSKTKTRVTPARRRMVAVKRKKKGSRIKTWLVIILFLAFAVWLAHLLGLIHLPNKPLIK
jgi:serine/threonine protein kinase